MNGIGGIRSRVPAVRWNITGVRVILTTILLAWTLLAWTLLLPIVTHAAEPDPPVHPDRRARLVDVTLLQLDGPLGDPRAEVSGLTWSGDTLVVLPQNPEIFGHGDNLGFFVLAKKDILERLDRLAAGQVAAPLYPELVLCQAAGMMRIIRGFDGLEAMGIMGDRIYMTVEAKEDTVMAGYLVSGQYAIGSDGVSIDMTRLTTIPLGLNIPNVAEESMIVEAGRVITFSEANGRNLVRRPQAKVFDAQIDYLGSIPFPTIEYRVTDATALDAEGRFWVINYFYPGERSKLKPAADPEVEKFGWPEGWTRGGCVERLLELRLTEDDRIVRTETPPINLRLAPDGRCRNWEALVRLDDRGFLMMTDKYPGTLFGFVPDPYRESE